MKLLKKLLIDKLLPSFYVGTEFYAHILGSLRQELTLRGFSAGEAHQIVITLLNKRKR